MTSDERQVLERVLSSLDAVQVDTYVYSHNGRRNSDDAYNYDGLGRQLMGKRMIAELLGIPQEHMLPGEFYEDESDLPDLHVYTPAIRSGDDEPLTSTEKVWIQTILLPVLSHLSGLSDSDDAVLRCVRREVAEVAGYPNLSHYRLMLEKEVKPLFFRDYKAEQI